MIVATTRLTFTEYLAYEDGTDNRYELVIGLGHQRLGFSCREYRDAPRPVWG